VRWVGTDFLYIQWELQGDIAPSDFVDITVGHSKEDLLNGSGYQWAQVSSNTTHYQVPYITPNSKNSTNYILLSVVSVEGDLKAQEVVSMDTHVYDPVAQEVAQDILMQISRIHGVPAIALIAKRYGVKCPSCWNSASRTLNVRRDCPVCYETGFVGGYHTPIITWSSFNVPKIKTSNRMGAVTTPFQNTQLTLPSWPILAERDVIILPTSARSFQVRAVQITDHRTTPVVQSCEVSELSRTHPTIKLFPWRTPDIDQVLAQYKAYAGFESRLL